VHGPQRDPHYALLERQIARLDKITIPAYIVASYINTLHTRGSFQAFRNISSEYKWLLVHNSSEWPDYYTPANVDDLTLFFDRYLKDANNTWEETPRVRLSVLNSGGVDTVGRIASDWPPPGM
jgi:predicted acyl esterase